MSNIIPLDSITLPAHLVGRSNMNSVFAAGLPQGGGFPMIGLKGTRFIIKNEGQETLVPTMEMSVILLSAKPNLDKAYYATKFDPNQSEAKSPDCFSKDGMRPDPAAVMKQAESCAGCPMNQFGSGVGADGSPSKGKACADSKMLALFTNNGVYGFKIPPASLKAFTNYVKDTSRRGVDLGTAVTIIGFDPAFSFPVLTFNFGGFLAEQQVAKIDQLRDSDEVREIVGAATAAPAPVKTIAPPALDPFENALVEEPPKKVAKPKLVKAEEAAPVVAEVENNDAAELAALLGL